MAFDGPRASLLLLLIFFFFLSPDTRGPSLARLYELESRVAQERAALQVLNASDYNAFDISHTRWFNLTGLRQQDGFAWSILSEVQDRARQQFDYAMSTLPYTANNSMPGSKDGHGRVGDAQENVVDSIDPFKEQQLPMYNNITSVLRGKWVHSVIAGHAPEINLTTLAPNISYATSKFARNITGFEGDIRLKLIEQTTDEEDDITSERVRRVKAEMVIKDDTSSGDGWDTTLFGVHFPRQGGLVLTTTSEKFAGIFALPHFARSGEAFHLSKDRLMKDLARVIDKQKSSPDAALNPWASTPDSLSENLSPTPHCELVLYLQQQLSDATHPQFEAIEQELRYPTGASMNNVPQIRMSAVMFSPDCGFVLESKGPPDYPPTARPHLTGRKIEAYMNEARKAVLVFAFLVCSEILLLKRQMNEASTPSTKSRISFYTIVIMALGDGFACMSLLVAGMLVDVLFLALVATAFLSFVCVSFFGMKFLLDIWNVQAPERQERERERQRARDLRNAEVASHRSVASTDNNEVAGSSSSAARNAAETESLPLPATAQRTARPPTPIIVTPDQDLDAAEADDAGAAAPTNNQTQPATTALGTARREMGALYSRFYFALLTILFLSLHATSWPITARSIYCNLLSFTYLSLWTPQIYRNIMRNCRKAVSWRFVIGESLLRLAPFAYFYIWEDNILFVDVDANAFFVLAGWVWIQVFVLATQEAVGPRIFVPEGWAPKAYDYHPVLREGDSEHGGNMPVGFTEAIASPTSPVATTSATSFSAAGKARHVKQREERSKRAFDCAICTDTFEVPVVPAGTGESEAKATAGAAATLFARRAYMVTPCRHIFHSACLEGWMRYRLQCPICREGLPPL